MADALATRTRTYSVYPSIMGEILATYGARTLTLKVNDCSAFLDVLLA